MVQTKYKIKLSIWKKTNTDSVQIQGVVNRFMKALLSVLMLPKRHLKTKQDVNKACLLIL